MICQSGLQQKVDVNTYMTFPTDTSENDPFLCLLERCHRCLPKPWAVHILEVKSLWRDVSKILLLKGNVRAYREPIVRMVLLNGHCCAFTLPQQGSGDIHTEIAASQDYVAETSEKIIIYFNVFRLLEWVWLETAPGLRMGSSLSVTRTSPSENR